MQRITHIEALTSFANALDASASANQKGTRRSRLWHVC